LTTKSFVDVPNSEVHNNGRTVDFNSISYNTGSSATHTYKIVESNSGNYTASPSAYYAVVNVTVKMSAEGSASYTASVPRYYSNFDDETNTCSGVVSAPTFDNTHDVKTTSVSGTKTWSDSDNKDGLRPESITVNLWKTVDGKKTKADSKEVRAGKDGKWAYSFDNLPTYENGKAITYSVTEDPVDGYATKVDGYNITNTHAAETVEVAGTKTWNDSDNQDGKRPKSISVTLSKTVDGTKSDVKTIDVKPDKDGNWSYSFGTLPKYENGKEIAYTVSEGAVDGYATKVDGYNITNTHAASTRAALKVTKSYNAWKDGVSFGFTLTGKDGAPMPEAEGNKATATNDAKTATFGDITFTKVGTYHYVITEDLPEGVDALHLTKDGITYDVAEHPVTVTVTDNGKGKLVVSKIDYDGKSSLKVKNTYTTEHHGGNGGGSSHGGSGSSGSGGSGGGTAQTGDATSYAGAAGLAAAGAALVAVAVRRRKREQE